MSEDLKKKVMKSMEEIKPALQAHGGDVELVDVVDGVVKVRLKGACSGCPGAQMTLHQGIERKLKADIPEVKSVQSVPY